MWIAITVHKSGIKVNMFLPNWIFVADTQQTDMFRRRPWWFILTSVHCYYTELQRTLTHCVWLRSHSDDIRVSPPIHYLCIWTHCTIWVTLKPSELLVLSATYLGSGLLSQYSNWNIEMEQSTSGPTRPTGDIDGHRRPWCVCNEQVHNK